MESLRGVFPPSYTKTPKRNFIRENVELLRCRSTSMSRLSSGTEPKKRPIRSVIVEGRLKSSASCNFCHQNLPIIPSMTAKSSDTASQTTDINDEYFLKDAIIRFPTARSATNKEVQSDFPPNDEDLVNGRMTPHLPRLASCFLSKSMTGLSVSQSDLTHTTTNARTRQKVKTNKIDSSMVHKPGEIPKYLIQRKKDLAHVEGIVDGPPGHYLLTDEERLEALHLAQGRYDNLVHQLNALSITSQTFRIRSKKIELERELQDLENTLKIFSRNKVYVNLGE